MRIIKFGTKPKYMEGTATCNNCNSELQYNEQDVKQSAAKDVIIHTVICPVCSQLLLVDGLKHDNN